jgi:hypothetical protein
MPATELTCFPSDDQDETKKWNQVTGSLIALAWFTSAHEFRMFFWMHLVNGVKVYFNLYLIFLVILLRLYRREHFWKTYNMSHHSTVVAMICKLS